MQQTICPVICTSVCRLNPKKPPGGALAEISSIFSQKAHAAVTDRLADGDGLAVYDVESLAIRPQSGMDEPAYYGSQFTEPSNPLFVAADFG